MKGEHLEFPELSDYYDGDMPTSEEMEAAREHLEECQGCSTEYTRLSDCIDHVKDYGESLCLDDDFSARTMAAYRKRRFTRRFMKAVPAAAAVMVLALGFTVFNVMPQNQPQTVVQEQSQTETETILALIRDSKGKINSVNSSYIEGEVPQVEFRDLRRKLGFRNVTYRTIKPGSRVATKPQTWRNLSPVGVNTNESSPVTYDVTASPASYEVVRFRVFLK